MRTLLIACLAVACSKSAPAREPKNVSCDTALPIAAAGTFVPGAKLETAVTLMADPDAQDTIIQHPVCSYVGAGRTVEVKLECLGSDEQARRLWKERSEGLAAEKGVGRAAVRADYGLSFLDDDTTCVVSVGEQPSDRGERPRGDDWSEIAKLVQANLKP